LKALVEISVFDAISLKDRLPARAERHASAVRAHDAAREFRVLRVDPSFCAMTSRNFMQAAYTAVELLAPNCPPEPPKRVNPSRRVARQPGPGPHHRFRSGLRDDRIGSGTNIRHVVVTVTTPCLSMPTCARI